MNTQHLLFSSAVTMLVGVLGTPAHAAPMTFRDVPASSAAAQIEAKYGIGVNLRGLSGVRVTFTVDDADAPGARLQAINALANAADADFTKTYVIGSAVAGNSVPAQIDVTTSLPSSQQAYPAKDAIAMVAGLDDATVQYAAAVDGTVTLTGSFLTVDQAAAQIARQTGTRWATIYTLEPRLAGRTSGGTIIGHTAGGSPIMQLASVYYHDAVWTARRKRIEADDQREMLAEQQAAQAQQASEQAALAQQAAVYAQRTGGVSPVNAYGAYGPSVFGQSATPAYGFGNGTMVIGGQFYGGSPSSVPESGY